jgi:hypothetical protein
VNATPAVRLSLRLQKVEITLIGVLVALGAAAGLALAARLEAIRPPASCTDEQIFGTSATACAIAGQAFYSLAGQLNGPITALLIGSAWLGALLIGTPIVAREVERGTTRLAWAMAPSRIRWFAARLLPALVVVAVATYAAGFAIDRIAGASASPGEDMSRSFGAFGFRGLLVASRAVFIFAIADATGAVLGRALPALIVAGIVAVVGLAGGERLHFEILEREAVVLEADQAGPGDWFVASMFRLPDGSLVSWEQIEQYDPQPVPDANGNFPPGADTWPHEPMVTIAVPGERYQFVEAREAAALAAGSFVALAIAAFAVNHRRPE